MCPRRSRRRAFSMIELLVVMAVIMLLVTILAPALSGVRRSAKTAHCLANLHAVGQAISMYADDHAEMGPPWSRDHQIFGGDGAGDDAPGPGWTEYLLHPGYLQDPRIFTDPARPRDEARFSYFLQSRFIWQTTRSPGAPLPKRLVLLPGAFVLGGDCNNPRLFPRPYGKNILPPDCDLDDALLPVVFFDDPPPAPAYFVNEAELDPHDAGRANLLFFDGHAATFTTFEGSMMTWHGSRMTSWHLN